jgi:hypothetical protein
VPEQSAACGLIGGVTVGASEQTTGHECECRDCGQGVVLLARGEGEEEHDEACPEEKGESGFAVQHTHAGGEVADVTEDGRGQEGCPGKDPEGGEDPEEEEGDLAVVVRDAALQEAGDVFVIEIEPGPTCVGGQAEAGGKRDSWIA